MKSKLSVKHAFQSGETRIIFSENRHYLLLFAWFPFPFLYVAKRSGSLQAAPRLQNNRCIAFMPYASAAENKRKKAPDNPTILPPREKPKAGSKQALPSREGLPRRQSRTKTNSLEWDKNEAARANEIHSANGAQKIPVNGAKRRGKAETYDSASSILASAITSGGEVLLSFRQTLLRSGHRTPRGCAGAQCSHRSLRVCAP